MSERRWILNDAPSDQELEELRAHLAASNVAEAGIDASKPLAFLAREPTGALVGGISGRTWGRVLEIRLLWVHETWRGRGLGRQLLVTAERAAVQRGCRVAFLDTFSFQAPGFYRQHGYEVFGEILGYPDAIGKLFMRKQLGRTLMERDK